jgi:hypothetical protein
VENLQLRPTFPDKPLIKTYVALWESCRSIAPLQLLFLEIFKFVDNFWTFAISKRLKRNKLVTGDVVAAPSASRVSGPRRPRGFRALPQRTDVPGVSAMDPRTAVDPPPVFLLCAAPSRPNALQAEPRARASARPRACSGQLASSRGRAP